MATNPTTSKQAHVFEAFPYLYYLVYRGFNFKETDNSYEIPRTGSAMFSDACLGTYISEEDYNNVIKKYAPELGEYFNPTVRNGKTMYTYDATNANALTAAQNYADANLTSIDPTSEIVQNSALSQAWIEQVDGTNRPLFETLNGVKVKDRQSGPVLPGTTAQDVKARKAAANPYVENAPAVNTTQTQTTDVKDTSGYPVGAPASLPEPLPYDQFVKEYFPDNPKNITDDQKKAEYKEYTSSFRNYVMSRTQYYDTAAGTYKYMELPAWDSVKLHRHLATDAAGNATANYAPIVAQPTEDYTTYIDTATGENVEQPLRTRGEQQDQGWYITRDQLNNIIYDAEQGVFKNPAANNASPTASSTTPATSKTLPTASTPTMRADAFLNPAHDDYQNPLALGQGPLTYDAATSWAHQNSSIASRPTLADLAASFKPGNRRTPTLFDLRK